jgi:hypothetical protein
MELLTIQLPLCSLLLSPYVTMFSYILCSQTRKATVKIKTSTLFYLYRKFFSLSSLHWRDSPLRA